MARQLKSRSGSTATLSGSTIIKENLTVIGSFSGGTVSGGTFYSGSTDLSSLIGGATNVQPGTNINTGGTVSDPIINLNNDISVNSLSATSITATTISAATLSANTIFVTTISGMSPVHINGTIIENRAFSGNSVHVRSSGNTILNLNYSDVINALFLGINGVYPPTNQAVAMIPPSSGLSPAPANGLAIFGDFRSDGYTQIRQGPITDNVNSRRIKLNEDGFGTIEIINGSGDTFTIDGFTGSTTWTAKSGITISGNLKATNLSATTSIFSGSSNLDTLFVNKGGYRNIWIDADKMVIFSVIGNPYSGATSNILLGEGDVYSGSSVNTDNIVAKYFLFTGGTYDQNVQFKFSMPDEWDLGTIKAKIYWDTELGASINDGVVWGIKAGALSNDDSLSGETVFGTEVLITDRVIIPQDLHITSASTAITIGGTPALDDLIYFQISRKVNNTNDTLAQEARLFGTKLQYKELTTNIVQW